MGNLTARSGEWSVTPVGRTALEQSLSRELKLNLSIVNLVFQPGETWSTTAAHGMDFGFHPRRAHLRTRLGREGERQIDLFFKIPWDKEVESYILGRRLGLRHQPRLVTTAVELSSPVGENYQAMVYFYHPGESLAATPPNGEDWRLPDGLLDDIANLHASTCDAADSYVQRGYPVETAADFKKRCALLEVDGFFSLPYLEQRRGELEPLLGRAVSRLDEAVDQAFASGTTVVHGDLTPYNVIIGADDEPNLIVDWGDFGVICPTADLAPCLAWDQLETYRELAKGHNPRWEPPGESDLAAMRLIHACENLARAARGWREQAPWLFERETEDDQLQHWLERIEDALERLE